MKYLLMLLFLTTLAAAATEKIIPEEFLEKYSKTQAPIANEALEVSRLEAILHSMNTRLGTSYESTYSLLEAEAVKNYAKVFVPVSNSVTKYDVLAFFLHSSNARYDSSYAKLKAAQATNETLDLVFSHLSLMIRETDAYLRNHEDRLKSEMMRETDAYLRNHEDG